MSTDRPRPPSVERLLAAVRPLQSDGVAPESVAAVAREVIEDERARLAAKVYECIGHQLAQAIRTAVR